MTVLRLRLPFSRNQLDLQALFRSRGYGIPSERRKALMIPLGCQFKPRALVWAEAKTKLKHLGSIVASDMKHRPGPLGERVVIATLKNGVIVGYADQCVS